jgi:putative thioredoxin
MGPREGVFKRPQTLAIVAARPHLARIRGLELGSMADSPYIIEIDADNYEPVVLRGSYQVPVLVDFWASWCQPCQVLMPVLARLAEEYAGRFILAKLNTEEQQAIAAQFGIRSIPTVKLFRNGQPVDEFMGALPEAQIRAFLDKHLPRPSDSAVLAAEQRLMAGDPAGALAQLEAARAEDPDNPRILLAIARLSAATGDFDAAEKGLAALPPEEQDQDEARQLRGELYFMRITATADDPGRLVARLEADPGDSAARFQLAALQMQHGEIEAALENLLRLMQTDRKYGDDAARKALLQAFDLIGDDPGVARYRARMFNLLH